MRRAFTRGVSPRLPECELTCLDRVPIDSQKAALQHACYEKALSDAGFAITRLPALPDAPDAVFVEDTAILLDGHAVLTRPGAPSRALEVQSTASGLESDFELLWIGAGYLDGGDVLRIENRLYVARSSRTDANGIAAFDSLARPLGFELSTVELRGGLHLKTSATFAGHDRAGRAVLLFDPSAVDPSHFERVDPLAVAEGEKTAANCVRAGDVVILPAGNPRTADMLRSRGFDVSEVDVSELQKAEAGVTCMSLIDERP